MKLLVGTIIATLLVTSCSSTKYQYQPQKDFTQWKGKTIQSLVMKWGDADQIIQSRTGSTYYIYLSNAGTNFFNSTTTNFSMSGEDGFPSIPQANTSLKCTTIFKTNADSIITDVKRQGSNCGGEWVP